MSEANLSDGMGFATLRPTFPEASAQLVELMRATLRHAQEITAAVGEAEVAASRAQAAVAAVDAATTPAERDVVKSEIDKLTAWLAPPPPTNDKGNNRFATSAYMQSTLTSTSLASSTALASTNLASFAPAPSAPSQAANADQAAAAGSDESGKPLGVGGGDGSGQRSDAENAAGQGAGGAAASHEGAEKQVALEFSEEIETTVMWVQQLLESVHFTDSDTQLDPGASLLGVVQPGRRHQKDVALLQSKKVFREKKEQEEEEDQLDTAIFRRLRGEALQAVSSQRAVLAARE